MHTYSKIRVSSFRRLCPLPQYTTFLKGFYNGMVANCTPGSPFRFLAVKLIGRVTAITASVTAERP